MFKSPVTIRVRRTWCVHERLLFLVRKLWEPRECSLHWRVFGVQQRLNGGNNYYYYRLSSLTYSKGTEKVTAVTFTEQAFWHKLIYPHCQIFWDTHIQQLCQQRAVHTMLCCLHCYAGIDSTARALRCSVGCVTKYLYCSVGGVSCAARALCCTVSGIGCAARVLCCSVSVGCAARPLCCNVGGVGCAARALCCTVGCAARALCCNIGGRCIVTGVGRTARWGHDVAIFFYGLRFCVLNYI